MMFRRELFFFVIVQLGFIDFFGLKAQQIQPLGAMLVGVLECLKLFGQGVIALVSKTERRAILPEFAVGIEQGELLFTTQ